MSVDIGRGFKRIFLIFFFLVPLNLFAERDEQKYDRWNDVIDIDDFTDEKVYTVWSSTRSGFGHFGIGYTPNGAYLYTVNITIGSVVDDHPCRSSHDDKIEVLFRVDKNKVFLLPMKKSSYGLFETDPYEIGDRDMWIDYIYYQEEMAKGDILRIRIRDKECNIDLEFPLKGFDEAIKRLRDELVSWMSS